MAITIVCILAVIALLGGIAAAVGKPALYGWVAVILLAVIELLTTLPLK